MHILALTAGCVLPLFNIILRASRARGQKVRGMKTMKTPFAFEYFLSPEKQPLTAQADSGPIPHQPSCLCSHFLHLLPEKENKIQQYKQGKIFPRTALFLP